MLTPTRSILDARASQPRERKRVTIIETVAAPVRKKRAKAAVKEYPPHEHFGSPLNICRVCGAKYTYVQKPIDYAGNK